MPTESQSKDLGEMDLGTARGQLVNSGLGSRFQRGRDNNNTVYDIMPSVPLPTCFIDPAGTPVDYPDLSRRVTLEGLLRYA